MDAAPAVAELVEAGATVEGDDIPSIMAATLAALDIALEQGAVAVGEARILALRFEDDGSVIVSALSDEAAAAIAPNLEGEGITSAKVEAEKIAEYIAQYGDEAEGEAEVEGAETPEAIMAATVRPDQMQG